VLRTSSLCHSLPVPPLKNGLVFPLFPQDLFSFPALMRFFCNRSDSFFVPLVSACHRTLQQVSTANSGPFVTSFLAPVASGFLAFGLHPLKCRSPFNVRFLAIPPPSARFFLPSHLMWLQTLSAWKSPDFLPLFPNPRLPTF